MHRRVLAQMVIVVENKDELLFNSFQNLVKENVRGALRMLRDFAGGFLKIRKHGLAKSRHQLLDAEGEITKKHRRVSVGVIQLIPDELSLVSSQKVCNQGRFSRAGIGCNEGQRVTEICEQTVR